MGMGRDTAQEMLRQHARSFAGHTARQFLAGKAKTEIDLDAPDRQGRCRITSSVKDVGDNFERDESLVEVELELTELKNGAPAKTGYKATFYVIGDAPFDGRLGKIRGSGGSRIGRPLIYGIVAVGLIVYYLR
jgi:hypothetical protein